MSFNPGYIFAGITIVETGIGLALITSAWRASMPRKWQAPLVHELPEDIETLNVNHWEGAL